MTDTFLKKSSLKLPKKLLREATVPVSDEVESEKVVRQCDPTALWEEAVTGGVLCGQCSPLDQAETPCIFHQAQNRYHSPTQPSKPYRD